MMNYEQLQGVGTQLHMIYNSPLTTPLQGFARTYISSERYQQVCWLVHVSRAYPEPPRKLRKCHLKSRQKRLRAERKRYR